MKAVEITDVSWILYDDNEMPIGLIVKKLKAYSLINKSEENHFESLEELYEHIGEPFRFNKRADKAVDIRINGLPVDTAEIFNIVEEGIASFTKSEKSQIKYAAGYWGLKFSAQYVAAFCPKVSTIEKYEHIGPYDQRIIMQSELLLANKRLQDESQS